MKIAVYAIAKNEEQFVEKWYNSAKDADYLCILDTGSSDKTVEIANSLGIKTKVQEFNPWRFDHARNESLNMIPNDADMCIALDMDEVLLPNWREEIEKAFADGVTRVRYQYTWSWKEDGTAGLQYGGDKIHLRHGYHWKHPVHEVIVCEGIEVQGWYGLEIHHYPDSSKSRSQYLPLLQLAVEEDLDDDRNAFYYARELFFNNRLDEAAIEFKRHLALPRAQWLPERAASMRYLAKCEGQNEESWYLKAYAECPYRREPLVDLAKYYLKTNQFYMSQAFALKALDIKEKPLEYLCEEEAWGWMPYDIAAVSSHYLGDKKAAEVYGRLAISKNPADPRLKENLNWYTMI